MWPMNGSKDPVSDLMNEQMDEETKKRIKRIRLAWTAYENELPDPLTETKSDLDPKGEDNTKVGYARKIVNLSAFFLFGKGIEIDATPDTKEGGDASEKDPTSEYLEKALDAQGDGREPFLLELATAGGIEGDVFVRLYPARPGEDYPRIKPLSAENVIVHTEPADYTDAYEFVVQWNAHDARINKPVVYRHTFTRQDNGKWQIVEEHSTGSGAWVNDLTEDWPFDFPPILHCKNLTWPQNYFGASDLEGDVLELVKALNFNISNVNRILRAHGHPQDYIAGQSVGDEIDKAIGKMLHLPNPDARIYRMEEVQELTAHSEQYRRLKEALHDLTNVPEVATGKVQDLGQLSGLALQILYAPLEAMILTKRKLYGRLLERICAAILEMSGKAVPAGGISLKWPEIVPVNTKEKAETAVILDTVGVSKATLLQELGYDPVEEEKKKGEEADAALEQAQRTFDMGGGGVGGPNGGPSNDPNGGNE